MLTRAPIPKVFYHSGVVVKADSIAELGQKIGVPGLVEGAARFNVLANQAQDHDFKRGLGHYDRYYGDPTQTPNPNLAPSRRRRSTRSIHAALDGVEGRGRQELVGAQAVCSHRHVARSDRHGRRSNTSSASGRRPQHPQLLQLTAMHAVKA